MTMRPHHVGCAVRDLETSAATYLHIGTRRSRTFEVRSQAVNVCFIELGAGLYLELIEGTGEGSPIERYYRTGFYHLCFLVDDLERARAQLGREFRSLPAFESEAFDGHRCQFLVTPESHLIELAETTLEDFSRFFEANVLASYST